MPRAARVAVSDSPTCATSGVVYVHHGTVSALAFFFPNVPKSAFWITMRASASAVCVNW